MEKLKAPFPYFGGKSKVADVVWKRFGNVKRYIEPFCGSCAVLLGRDWDASRQYDEIINDFDGNITNVWRSIKYAPEKVAYECDFPVSHVELIARRNALIRNLESLKEKLIADPKYYDAELAGYWIWGKSCWIGTGFVEKGKENKNVQISEIDIDKGINCQIPSMGNQGINSNCCKIPMLSGNIGINCNTPELRDNIGVNKKGDGIYNVLNRLSSRLRNVKTICGDWKRCLGGNWQTSKGDCGVFLDPPYSTTANRRSTVYTEDSGDVSMEVLEWCKQHGSDKKFRIAIAGYDGEHNELEKLGWTVYEWKANGGYANQGTADSIGKVNCKKERIWFSPYCLKESKQNKFF